MKWKTARIPNNLIFRPHLYIGKLNESSLKHRGAIIVLSALLIFIDRDVTVTLGSGSLAGLGISVSPPQHLPIGFFLVLLLVYRLITFWVTGLIDEGTNPERAEMRSIDAIIGYQTVDTLDLKNREHAVNALTAARLDIWSFFRTLWEFVLPSIIGVSALIAYGLK